MTEAQTILKIIESVDPEDTDTLDEIDARVYAYEKSWSFKLNPCPTFKYEFSSGKQVHRIGRNAEDTYVPRYTRSRDALKSIRPEGWYPIIYALSNGAGCIMGFQVSLFGLKNKVDSPNSITKPLFSTEELAELHAIIQAIEWERQNDSIGKPVYYTDGSLSREIED